jgi:nucleoside phosphorylase
LIYQQKNRTRNGGGVKDDKWCLDIVYSQCYRQNDSPATPFTKSQRENPGRILVWTEAMAIFSKNQSKRA